MEEELSINTGTTESINTESDASTAADFADTTTEASTPSLSDWVDELGKEEAKLDEEVNILETFLEVMENSFTTDPETVPSEDPLTTVGRSTDGDDVTTHNHDL